VVVEQVIRPTGLVDPEVEIRPVKGQIDDLLGEIRDRAKRGERVLVTTLTKRMAEDLAGYYTEVGVRCRYMHSEIETLERVKLLAGLRKGEFDVLIGINLLREGLDLPEVSLVAILDADKEGFLRSAGSLIQTMGRAARHIEGRAILYADRDHRLDAAGDGRDRPAADDAAGLQRGERDYAAVDHQPGGYGAGADSEGRVRRGGSGRDGGAAGVCHRRRSWTLISPSWRRRCARRPRSSSSRRRRGCATRSRSCGRRSFCSGISAGRSWNGDSRMCSGWAMPPRRSALWSSRSLRPILAWSSQDSTCRASAGRRLWPKCICGMPSLPVLVLGNNGEAADDYAGEFVRFLPRPVAGEEMLALAGEMLAKHEFETV
jgi:hypothetical protein